MEGFLSITLNIPAGMVVPTIDVIEVWTSVFLQSVYCNKSWEIIAKFIHLADALTYKGGIQQAIHIKEAINTRSAVQSYGEFKVRDSTPTNGNSVLHTLCHSKPKCYFLWKHRP